MLEENEPFNRLRLTAWLLVIAFTGCAGKDLVVTRQTDDTCAKEIVIPEAKLKADLPLDKESEVPRIAARADRSRVGSRAGGPASA